MKGGIFLYDLFNGDFTRVTSDLDLLAKKVDNEFEIFSLKVDDALNYDLKSLFIKKITEFKSYHGVKISIIAYLDRTKIPISIDIGFGDIISPERILMDFPCVLEMEIPKIYSYSLNSVIAEKFEAILPLGYVNSRSKDFYDINILASNYDFQGKELKKAIAETFIYRKTEFDDIVAIEKDFAIDPIRRGRWEAFIKKKKAMIVVDITSVVNLIKDFLEPVITKIIGHEEMGCTWNAQKKEWK